MTPRDIELLAAAAIRDRGISLPLRTVLRRKPLRLTMKIPVTMGLIRVSELYLKMGVRAKDYADYTPEQRADFIARHGRAVSRIIAYGIVRGPVVGTLLNRPVAWLLRGCMDPLMLGEAWRIVLDTINTAPFGSITASLEAVNRLSPIAGRCGKRS